MTHPSNGVYDISFEGLIVEDDNTVMLVTPNTPSTDCTATNASSASNATTTFIVVETKDCNGTATDRGFHRIHIRLQRHGLSGRGYSEDIGAVSIALLLITLRTDQVRPA